MNKRNIQANRDRRARLQAFQAQQEATDRRRNVAVYGTVLLLVAGIAAAVTFVIVDEIRQDTALRTQLAVDDAEDPPSETFLAKYIQGPQTPEAGAPCTGGVDA
ncbi:hypothetical protein [uncultured Arthrobacter sp.]|uniref:hypothetical protein n=1 Tax=uncultured Arthrobacter sp. TaxID=114050 RepID=UPI0026315FAB|nr:hypothetical protein [uncultured Arthrobacter sp.]